MIEVIACGCLTKPIKAKYRIKQHLLAGKTIIMDNPIDEDAPILFMQYKNMQALSVVEFPNEQQLVGKFDFHRGLEICLEHWEEGWDCCYSEMTFMQDGEDLQLIH